MSKTCCIAEYWRRRKTTFVPLVSGWWRGCYLGNGLGRGQCGRSRLGIGAEWLLGEMQVTRVYLWMKFSNVRRKAKPWRRMLTVSMTPVYLSCLVTRLSSNKSALLLWFGFTHLDTQHERNLWRDYELLKSCKLLINRNDTTKIVLLVYLRFKLQSDCHQD